MKSSVSEHLEIDFFDSANVAFFIEFDNVLIPLNTIPYSAILLSNAIMIKYA